MSRNLFEYHSVIGYRFVPGIRARVRHEGGGYLVNCNQSGFRCDRESVPAKAEGVFRVVLCGDSYSAGEGVSNRYRFGDLLEDRIPGIEVLNFALPGSGTDQQLLAFREYASKISYDLLLLCPMVENIQRNMQTHRLTQNASDGALVRRAKPYFRLEGGELALHNTPVPKQVEPMTEAEAALAAAEEEKSDSLRGRISELIDSVDDRLPGFRDLLDRMRNIRWPKEYEDPMDPAWQLMKAILTAFVAENTAPTILCPIPTFAHVQKVLDPSGYLARFTELSSELEIELADVLPDFWKLSTADRRRCRFPVDDHPTRYGHAVLADALTPAVERAVRAAREAA